MAPPLVLLVEDFPDTREMYQEFLEFAGLRVCVAVNGLDAIALAVRERPDVIVMDMSLPLLDGYEAMRRIKADPRSAAIPIAALTGSVSPTAEQEARSAGADYFLAKPCLPRDLAREVSEIVKRSAAARASST